MIELHFYAVICYAVFTVCLVLAAKFFHQEIHLFKFGSGLLLSVVLAVLFSLPQLISFLDYSSRIARQPTPLLQALRRQPYFPVKPSGWGGILGFPLDLNKAFQHFPFFSVFIMAIIFYALLKWKKMSPPQMAVAGLFISLVVFGFVGYLDIPLLLVSHYRKFANQVRIIHFIYAVAGILFVYGIYRFKETFKPRLLKPIYILTFLQLFFLLYFSFRVYIQHTGRAALLTNPWFIGAVLCIGLQGLAVFYNYKYPRVKPRYVSYVLFA
ncbi:MAG: hypothetical protein GY940_06225, partial [bacterium]|nr:hypothetical protein [bacterium]